MPLVAALRRSGDHPRLSAVAKRDHDLFHTPVYTLAFRGSDAAAMAAQEQWFAGALSPELQRALELLLAGIEWLSERIRGGNERIEKLGGRVIRIFEN